MTSFIQRNWGVFVLAALLFCIYTLSNAGRLHIVDEASLFALTESAGLHGRIDTNAIAWTQFVNSPGEVLGAFAESGDVYSKKGPAPALLAIPWFLALRLLTALNIEVGMLQGTLLWNGTLTAFTAAALWLTSRRLGYRERTSMWLGLLFGLATIAWPYANQYFGEPLSALGLLLTFLGILSWKKDGKWSSMLLAGVGAGVAIGTVTAHAVLVAILALYAAAIWWTDRRKAGDDRSRTLASGAAFVAPILLAGGLLLLYNWLRFGNPLDTGYHFDAGEGFTTPIWQGFWGLIFSPYRSVFLHTPLFVASIFAFAPFLRRHRLEAATIALLSLVLVGMYSMWWMWWGGYAWGPRFLVPLTPFWVLVLAPLVENLALHRRPTGKSSRDLFTWARDWGFVALALLSVLVQVAATTVNFVNYETLLREEFFATDWSDPLLYGPPAQSLSDLLLSPVFGQLRLVARGGLVANSDTGWLMTDGVIGWTLLFVGMAAMLTLAWQLWRWLRAHEEHTVRGDILPRSPGAPMMALVAIIPLLLLGAWMGTVASDVNYGAKGTGYRAALDAVCEDVSAGDVIVNIAPFGYHIPMNWLASACNGSAPDVYGYALDAMAHEQTERVLNRLLQEEERIAFVTAGVAPNATENTVEFWLAQNAFKADDQWYDDHRLLYYATGRALQGIRLTNHNLLLTEEGANSITIVSSRTPDVTAAGSIVPIEVEYMLHGRATADLRWFVQLLSPAGVAVAQLDTGPEDNYTLFTALSANDLLLERAGLVLPADLPAGDYQIIVGLYNPTAEGAPRLRAADGREFLTLKTLRVE